MRRATGYPNYASAQNCSDMYLKWLFVIGLPALLHFAWVIFWGGVWNHGKQSNKENPACWGRLCEGALLYMPIWAHHHAVPMCITIATMWMHNMQHHATLLGAKLDKAGANRKCRFADDPPHHSITYHYRITYTYQSRGHSLANIEVHKMKVPKQTIGTLRAFGGLAGGLKCSWVRTWNIRREQSIPLHRIMTLGLSLRNAVGGSSIAFCSRLENSRTHEMLCTPQLNLVCWIQDTLFSTTFRRVLAHPEAGQSLENSGLQGTSGSPSIWDKTLGNHCAFEWWGRYLWLP